MKKILLLILEGAELMEIAPFTDVFGWNNILKKEQITLVTAGFEREIRCCWNLSLIPELILTSQDGTADSYKNFDALIIPGGFGKSGYFKNLNNPLLGEIINHFNRSDKLILGICTGSILLGEYGALKNRKATTYLMENRRYFNQLETFGAVPIFEDFVIDGNLVTTSAPGSGLKSAFELLTILSSRENSAQVKREMGFEF